MNKHLHLQSKYITKGATAKIEKKQSKLTRELIPSENPNIKKQIFNQNQRIKCVVFTISALKFLTV